MAKKSSPTGAAAAAAAAGGFLGDASDPLVDDELTLLTNGVAAPGAYGVAPPPPRLPGGLTVAGFGVDAAEEVAEIVPGTISPTIGDESLSTESPRRPREDVDDFKVDLEPILRGGGLGFGSISSSSQLDACKDVDLSLIVTDTQ